MPIDPELIAEAKRRGLVPAPKAVDPELIAEAKRRGLTGAAPKTPSMRERLIKLAAEQGPEMAGASMGASVAGIPGAGIGAAAGKAYGRIGEYLSGERDPASDTMMGNASDIAMSGLGGLTGETAIRGAGAGLKAIRPGATKLGAQVLGVTTGIPEKYGAAALGDLDMLGRAPSKAGVSKAYSEFEAKHGLTGLQKLAEDAWEDQSAEQLKGMALGAAKKITTPGAMPVNQELYAASQAARKIRDLGKKGDPDSIKAAASGLVGKSKEVVDAALEKSIPGYQALRQKAFEGKTKEAFSSVMPLKQNMSANALRGVGGLSAAGYELKEGEPGKAALILAAMSPKAAGLAIRGAAASTPLAKLLIKLGIRKKAAEIVDEE